jgi:acetylornithine deacetylase/succinyl-diaminopimelate desuccinylase-like protein
VTGWGSGRSCPTCTCSLAGRLLAAVAAVLLLASSAHAAGTLPDVEIVLVVEVDDVTGWLVLHETVLATTREAAKALVVSAGAATGGRRTISVVQPRFDIQIYVAPGVHSVRVMVSGKIPGAEALRGLTLFQASVLAIQAGALDNELTLAYGISGVRAELLELHLGRP